MACHTCAVHVRVYHVPCTMYKVDVGIMGHLSSSVNFLGCDYWKKARFMVLHNKDMEILKIKLFQ